MPPQGDLIQLSPAAMGRYINPKGGSSRPAVSLSCKNSSTGPTGQLTGSIARVKHHDSKTPHLEEYSFLVAGALALAMVSWTSAGKPSITALGPVWAIPTTSQSSGWGCQILPWSWDSKSRLIGISQGGRYKRGVSSENQVWEGPEWGYEKETGTAHLHSA